MHTLLIIAAIWLAAALVVLIAARTLCVMAYRGDRAMGWDAGTQSTLDDIRSL